MYKEEGSLVTRMGLATRMDRERTMYKKLEFKAAALDKLVG